MSTLRTIKATSFLHDLQYNNENHVHRTIKATSFLHDLQYDNKNHVHKIFMV
ncbi:hypothetical protein LINPERHAP1_LOCUS13535 [Linum perenne]